MPQRSTAWRSSVLAPDWCFSSAACPFVGSPFSNLWRLHQLLLSKSPDALRLCRRKTRRACHRRNDLRLAVRASKHIASLCIGVGMYHLQLMFVALTPSQNGCSGQHEPATAPPIYGEPLHPGLDDTAAVASGFILSLKLLLLLLLSCDAALLVGLPGTAGRPKPLSPPLHPRSSTPAKTAAAIWPAPASLQPTPGTDATWLLRSMYLR